MSRAEVRLRWRPAALSDGRLLWRWRNDPATRRQSGHSERVPWGEHREWLARRLDAPGFGLWIALDGKGVPLGQLRLESAEPGCAEVSISVASGLRGRGIGTAMLRQAPRRLGRTTMRRLLARVKPENPASAIAFLRAGFRFIRVERRRGASFYLLELVR